MSRGVFRSTPYDVYGQAVEERWRLAVPSMPTEKAFAALMCAWLHHPSAVLVGTRRLECPCGYWHRPIMEDDSPDIREVYADTIPEDRKPTMLFVARNRLL